MLDSDAVADKTRAMERRERNHRAFVELQTEICDAIAEVDGTKTFGRDDWKREGGGGGCTRTMEDGAVVEKAAVNVSSVHGEMSEDFSKQVPGEGQKFFATGISLIIHPRNPHAPTVHANFRYLEKGEGAGLKQWFGGGADLTPWVLYEEDAVAFHQAFKDVCDRHACVDHARLKKWCDDYFYLPHRKETRGVGGIFFDYLGPKTGENGLQADLDDAEAFVRDAGPTFIEAYRPILERRASLPHTEEEKAWQLHRRGRYVEFNLIHDRGTIFGLKTGGRTESILASLPKEVNWSYMHGPKAGTYQQTLVDLLMSPKDWV